MVLLALFTFGCRLQSCLEYGYLYLCVHYLSWLVTNLFLGLYTYGAINISEKQNSTSEKAHIFLATSVVVLGYLNPLFPDDKG